MSIKDIRIPHLFITLSICFLAIGCSKKGPEADLTHLHILKLLPKENIGFIAWSTRTPGFKKMLNSKYGSKSLVIADSPSSKRLFPGSILTESLSRIGLFSSMRSHYDYIREGLFFATQRKNGLLEFALYLIGANVDLTVKLHQLKQNISYQGILTEDISSSAKEGFSFVLSKGQVSRKIFIKGTRSLMSISTLDTLADAVFTLGSKPKIPDSSSILSPCSTLHADLHLDKAFAFGCFRLDRLKNTQLIGSAIPHSFFSSPIPLIFNRRFEGHVIDELSIGIPKVLLKMARGFPSYNADMSELLNLSPYSTIAAIHVNGKLIKHLLTDPVISSAVNNKAANAYKGVLQNIKNLAINIATPQSDAMFPSLVSVFQSDNPAFLLKNIRETLEATSGTQKNSVPKNNASIQCRPVFFVQLCTGQKGGTVVLSTSKEILEEILTSGPIYKNSKSLTTKLFKISPNASPHGKNMLFGFSNFPRIANIMESFAQQASLFGGESSKAIDESLTRMKKMGIVVFTVEGKQWGALLTSHYF